jgi:hypothetical protein
LEKVSRTSQTKINCGVAKMEQYVNDKVKIFWNSIICAEHNLHFTEKNTNECAMSD